jgi:phosphate-selective porin OprO/OprP
MNTNASCLTAVFLATLLPFAAMAQTSSTTTAPDDQLAQTSILQARPPSDASVILVSSENAPPAPVKPVSAASASIPAVSATSEGLVFSTADGSDTLKVHGYLQAQNRMFDSTLKGAAPDIFLFRKIRPIFEGTLFNALDFRFMPDFGQYTPQIQEAYVELKSVPFAKVRIGKFKEPIGLEVLRSDRDLIFIERSTASDLLPLRYLGAQLSGSILSNSISYAAGYFNGSSDGTNGVFSQWTQSNEGAARLFLQPLTTTNISFIRGFGLGVAGSAGHQHGAIPGLKTVGQSTFFKYSSGVLANGEHNRISPQAYYYGGPVGLLGEYAISSQHVIKKADAGAIKNEAWEVTGSVALTGEKNSYDGIRPRKSFEPSQGFRHLGALELALRTSQVRIDHAAFPFFASTSTAAGRANEYGIGLNWYLNNFVKLSTDYERTVFGMAASTVSRLHNENVLMSQLQLGF